MRTAWALYGLGFVVLVVGAVYAFNLKSGSSADTGASITNSSPVSSMATSTFSLTSSAFEHNGAIPPKYTCDGQRDVSPPLSIFGVPEGAKSLALLMDDPDIPQVFKEQRGIDSFDHWTLFNIEPQTVEIPEGGSAGTAGVNSAGKNAYTGPCPPSEYEPSEHRYFFKLYALDTELSLPPGATKRAVLDAIDGHVIAEAALVGRYKRAR